MTSDEGLPAHAVAQISALPLDERAAAYASLLERLRGELENDGRG